MSRRVPAKPPLNKRHCCSSITSTKPTSSQFRPIHATENNIESRPCDPDQNYLNSNDPSPVFGGTFANILLAFASAYKNGKDGTGQKSHPTKGQGQPNRCSAKVDSSDCLTEDNKHLLCSYVFNDIIGCDFIYRGPFGRNIVTYLDYVASGRSLKCIEQYIRQYVMPTYSNTHTEVNYIAEQTTRFREEARDIIRECVNASHEDVVIFTGSGATAAVNKLIVAMNIRALAKDISPIVFVGPYEHHSNILPWREIATKVITIRQLETGLVDLDNLRMQLEVHTKCSCSTKHLLIGSFSAASNVTGILTDVDSLATLMHAYGGFVFFDYACAAPYTDIDMNPREPGAYKDAVFISPHKFIGGPQTPGVLVAKKSLFQNPVPHGAGGGTVVFVRRTSHSYTSNVEHREEGGTPGIIESIRAGLVFKLKMAFSPQFIMKREHEMFKLANDAWSKLPNLLIMGKLNVARLPIFPLLFLNPETGRFVHHDFVAKMLNDVFGIQVRSGCACAGPYGMDLLGVTEKTGEILEKLVTARPDGEYPIGVKARNMIFKPGFVRLNFPYFMPEDCVNFVLKAIQMTSEKGWSLLPLYDFNRDTSQWWNRAETNRNLKRSLHDVTFKTGQFGLKKSAQNHSASLNPEAENWAFQPALSCVSEAGSYDEILERAERIFAEAATPERFDIPDTSMDFTVEEDVLRWFMLPSEAADIVNHRQVKHLIPEDLPFLPVALKEKVRTSLRKC